MHWHGGCAGLARGSFDVTGSKDNYPPDTPVVPRHLALDVHVDLEARALWGSVTLTLEARQPNVTHVSLDARELTVSSVERAAKPLVFRQEAGKLHVDLDAPTASGASVDLTVTYRVEQPRLGLYFVGPDRANPNAPLQAWTQCQDDDAPYWFPCLDLPHLKATTAVRCTVKKGLRVISNGPCTSKTENADGTTTFSYQMDVPHPAYLVTLVVGQFAELVNHHGDKPVRYFVAPGREEEAYRSFGKTPQMLTFFEGLLKVDYPYAEYNQVAVADFIFGGMENTGCSTMMDRTLHDGRAHLDFSSDELVAHELAHQWFGDLVTCRAWAEGWLNEGFATYMASLWMEHDEGKNEFLYDLWLHARRYFEEDVRRYRRPIVTRRYQEPVDLFDRHLYEKGARVLHLLRCELGDTAFFDGVSNYVKKHARGAADTDDLRRALEESSGRNLERFFDDWVRAGGHPDVSVEYSYDATAKLAVLTLAVGPRAETGRPWALNIPVRIHCGANVITRTLKLDTESQRFPIPVTDRPTRVVVDPDDTILKTLRLRLPEELLINQLREDPSAMARIRAVFALQDLPTKASLDALEKALLSDAFWGVQADAATALGEMRGGRALQILTNALSKVTHPKARRAVVRALGNWQHPDAARALEERLKQGDASYFVEQEAASALGRTKDAGAVAVLKGVLQTRDSWLDVVRAGCVTGLGETRDAAAYDVVRAHAEPGHALNVRLAALAAMARLGRDRPLASTVVSDLDRLCGDKDFRITNGILGAAEALNDLGSLGMVERIQRQGPDGRLKRRAEEVARSLRAGRDQKEALDTLRGEVDRLKEEVRALRDRTTTLEHTPKAAG